MRITLSAESPGCMALKEGNQRQNLMLNVRHNNMLQLSLATPEQEALYTESQFSNLADIAGLLNCHSVQTLIQRLLLQSCRRAQAG